MSISMDAGQKVRSGGCGLLPLLQYSNTPLFFGDKCEREEQRNTKRAEQRNLPVSAPPPPAIHLSYCPSHWEWASVGQFLLLCCWWMNSKYYFLKETNIKHCCLRLTETVNMNNACITFVFLIFLFGLFSPFWGGQWQQKRLSKKSKPVRIISQLAVVSAVASWTVPGKRRFLCHRHRHPHIWVCDVAIFKMTCKSRDKEKNDLQRGKFVQGSSLPPCRQPP